MSIRSPEELKLQEKLCMLFETDEVTFIKSWKAMKEEIDLTLMYELDVLAFDVLFTLVDMIEDELKQLEEQFAEDKEMRYLVETCKIEGWFYTLTCKLNVKHYVGDGTLYHLTSMFKAANNIVYKYLHQE